MSLKGFHVFFITLSTLLALVAGVWGMEGYFSDGSLTRLGWGILSLVGACALIVYGVKVREKLKDVGEPPGEVTNLKE